MELSKLEDLVGRSAAKEYVLLVITIYILVYELFISSNFGSTGYIIDYLLLLDQSLLEVNTNVNKLFIEMGYKTAIISIFAVRYVIYFRNAGRDMYGVIYTSVSSLMSIIALFFWWSISFIIYSIMGIALLFPLNIGFSISGASDLSLAAVTEWGRILGFIITFGVSTAIVVWRSKLIFPDEYRENISELNTYCDGVSQKISNIKSSPKEENPEDSVSKLLEIKEELQSYTQPEPLPAQLQNDLSVLNNKLQELSETMCHSYYKAAESAIADQGYSQAYTYLRAAEEIENNFDVSDPGLESIRAIISDEFERRSVDLMDEIQNKINRVNRLREDQRYERAETLSTEVNNEVTQLREMPTVEVSDQLNQSFEKMNRRLNNKIEKNQIKTQKEVIASQYDMMAQDISISKGSISHYERLANVLRTIQEITDTYPEFPWEKLEDTIITNSLTLTVDDVNEYEIIVVDSLRILEYLSEVDHSHPSIDVKKWQDAIKTALKEQQQYVLNPIVSKIERLESGLWEQDQFYNLSWEEFEELIGLLYDDLGYDVEVTQGTADFGVDVWAESPEERIAIQVKQYAEGNTVGREPLQKLASTIAKGEADKVVIVTSGTFTKTANDYASDFDGMRLIDGEELVQLLSESIIPPAI